MKGGPYPGPVTCQRRSDGIGGMARARQKTGCDALDGEPVGHFRVEHEDGVARAAFEQVDHATSPLKSWPPALVSGIGFSQSTAEKGRTA